MTTRQKGGEEQRFREAFERVLKRDPNTAPSPTQINMELRKHERDTYHSPLNVLNGRMNALRKQLLTEAGFVQTEKWARWHKPAPNLYMLEDEAGSWQPSTREECNALIMKHEAEWAGTDADPETGIVTHYAQRIPL